LFSLQIGGGKYTLFMLGYESLCVLGRDMSPGDDCVLVRWVLSKEYTEVKIEVSLRKVELQFCLKLWNCATA
jgi:hypothetical protein